MDDFYPFTSNSSIGYAKHLSAKLPSRNQFKEINNTANSYKNNNNNVIIITTKSILTVHINSDEIDARQMLVASSVLH